MKTKAKLGHALKKLMANDPLDSISVIRITNECKVNRQTFYYHFRNIYDLLTWVYLNEEIEKPENDELEEGLFLVLQYIKLNDELIINTLRSAAKDLVREFLFNYLYNISLSFITKKDHKSVISSNERKLLARVYAAGITSAIISWLEDELSYPENEFIMKLVTFFNPFPLDAIRNKGVGYA